jgi:ribosomal protein L44E
MIDQRKSSSNVHVAKKSSNRSLNAKPRPRADKKQKELRNFYRFQMKEEKVNKLQSLREKFDQDRQRIAAMKAARGNRSLV